MKARALLPLLLAVSLVVPFGTGCRALKRRAAEKATEKALEESTGAKNVDLSSGGIKVETAQGEKMDFGTGAKLPDGWPSYAPQYPGSTIMAAMATPNGKTVTAQTTDNPEKVTAFYKDKLSGAGFKQQVAGNFGGMQTLTMTKDNGKSNAVVSASVQNGKTMITVSITER